MYRAPPTYRPYSISRRSVLLSLQQAGATLLLAILLTILINPIADGPEGPVVLGRESEIIIGIVGIIAGMAITFSQYVILEAYIRKSYFCLLAGIANILCCLSAFTLAYSIVPEYNCVSIEEHERGFMPLQGFCPREAWYERLPSNILYMVMISFLYNLFSGLGYYLAIRPGIKKPARFILSFAATTAFGWLFLIIATVFDTGNYLLVSIGWLVCWLWIGVCLGAIFREDIEQHQQPVNEKRLALAAYMRRQHLKQRAK